MSPAVFEVFESALQHRKLAGPILEIGATRAPDTLLHLPCLRDIQDKIGINLVSFPDGNPTILRMNANDLGTFADGYFKLVLCNSVLEHDLYFWKTLKEMHRVTAPGGVMAIGVPGYAGMGVISQLEKSVRLPRIWQRLLPRSLRVALDASALTLGEHFYPGDYYRFSREAVRQLFMAGLESVEIHESMLPPRFIGVGTMP